MSDNHYQNLKNRIEDRTAHIGIIGLGYVGLPLARAFCDAGYAVNGFDVDSERAEALNRGETPLSHIPREVFKKFVDDGVFYATDDFKLLRRMDVAIICVPTPITPARDPDLSYVKSAADQLRKYMNAGCLVVLESTTYPGTTRDVVLPILEESGLYCGEDFFLAYSPEREDPGNAHFETADIPKLVGGIDQASSAMACSLYSGVVGQVIEVHDASTAEAAKILENIYRAVNIALVNELKVLFDTMGINVWEVIEAASSKPFGFQAFYPGPGLGGHCIPIDPFYLAWRAREYGMPTRFIELAGEINTVMPDYVGKKLIDALNQEGKALSRSRVLVLGVAYKRDVEDMRESPALRLIELLEEKGAEVCYHDPHVPLLSHGGIKKESMRLEPELLSDADATLIVTDHDAVDYSLVAEHANLIIDTRNVLNRKGLSAENVVLA